MAVNNGSKNRRTKGTVPKSSSAYRAKTDIRVQKPRMNANAPGVKR